MPVRIVEFQTTPNPSALRCVLDAPVVTAPLSVRSRPAPGTPLLAEHPLAAAIMAIPGVHGLLLHPLWLTITKDPSTPWAAVKPALARVLAAAQPLTAPPPTIKPPTAARPEADA